MPTGYSFILQFCCTLILTNLDTCSSNNVTYPNEICFPDHWIVIKGDWSFTNTLGSCAITNNRSTNNIAILPYKSWTYLNTIQDPTYQIEIEYNFTITAASANNTIGSLGVIWFPDSAPTERYDYMGVSFEKNEAFAASARGINPNPYYDNMDSYISNEGDRTIIVHENKGKLPLTLSVNTPYSLRMEIYSITDRSAKHDIYINNHLTLSQMMTYYRYRPGFAHNTSWIGLKSWNTTVVSHSLTVYQTSNPDSGGSVIRYFNNFTTATGTPHVQISESTDITHSTTTETQRDDQIASSKTQLSTTVLVIIILIGVVAAGTGVLLWYLYYCKVRNIRMMPNIEEVPSHTAFPSKNASNIDEICICTEKKKEGEEVIEPNRGMDEAAVVTVGNDELYYGVDENGEAMEEMDGNDINGNKSNELHRTVEGDGEFGLATPMEGPQIACDEFIVEGEEVNVTTQRPQ